MSRKAALLSVKWLKNHGLEVRRTGAPPEFVPCDGAVPVSVACRALDSNEMMVYRLVAAGHLRTRAGAHREVVIRLSSLRAVRRQWDALGKKTTQLERAAS